MRKNNYNTHIYKSKDFQILCKESYDLKILKKGTSIGSNCQNLQLSYLIFPQLWGTLKKDLFIENLVAQHKPKGSFVWPCSNSNPLRRFLYFTENRVQSTMENSFSWNHKKILITFSTFLHDKIVVPNMIFTVTGKFSSTIYVFS